MLAAPNYERALEIRKLEHSNVADTRGKNRTKVKSGMITEKPAKIRQKFRPTVVTRSFR